MKIKIVSIPTVSTDHQNNQEEKQIEKKEEQTDNLENQSILAAENKGDGQGEESKKDNHKEHEQIEENEAEVASKDGLTEENKDNHKDDSQSESKKDGDKDDGQSESNKEEPEEGEASKGGKADENKDNETEGQVVSLTLPGLTGDYIQTMSQVLAQQTLGDMLKWCCSSLPNFYQVTSFGSAGMVVIHELHKLELKVPVIFLDTLYHFAETLAHARAVEQKYGLTVDWYRCPKASTRAEFEETFKSTDMWISHPRRFEYLTKVEPLERALAELKVGAWITGRRRQQGAMRAEIPILEMDVDGRIKVNPLAHWTREEVWGYLVREGVPYNPLFDQSYASIGDTVTTTKTTDLSLGERSGRFHQFGGAKTECGIHVRTRPAYPNSLTSSGSLENDTK